MKDCILEAFKDYFISDDVSSYEGNPILRLENKKEYLEFLEKCGFKNTDRHWETLRHIENLVKIIKQ